jgi:hypothetical protein
MSVYLCGRHSHLACRARYERERALVDGCMEVADVELVCERRACACGGWCRRAAVGDRAGGRVEDEAGVVVGRGGRRRGPAALVEVVERTTERRSGVRGRIEWSRGRGDMELRY